MADLLALLDTLDGLMVAMTPGPYCRAHHGAWELQARPNQRLADFGTIDHAADDAQAVQALLNAYPRLAQALRTALTPTTDGERSVRTMFEHLFGGECGARVDVRDEDGDQLYVDARCIRCKGHDGAHDHLTPDYSVVDIAFGLRTALNLLAAERAKVAALMEQINRKETT